MEPSDPLCCLAQMRTVQLNFKFLGFLFFYSNFQILIIKGIKCKKLALMRHLYTHHELIGRTVHV